MQGDGDYVNEISDHIERYIGPIHMVWHEIVSDLVHIDVYHIVPSDEQPYHILVTGGMGEVPMNVPDAETPIGAELVIRLPADWPISKEAFQDEANWWPVRMLKHCARLPHMYDTWLGPGHTVTNGDPLEPFVSGSLLCGVMTIEPDWLALDAQTLHVGERSVHFLEMIPLTAAEMDYKLQNGSTALLTQLRRMYSRNADLFRNSRRCAAAKRAWWKFW